MLRNYFKIAWRNLGKNRVYSAIHLVGITVGLWACLVVATIVNDALSYDSQWSRAEDIYRVISVNKTGEGSGEKFKSSFEGLGFALKKNFAEVESHSEIDVFETRLGASENVGNAPVAALRMMRADTNVWNFLDLKILEGEPNHYAHGSKNLVITRSFRDRYFPGKHMVGRHLFQYSEYSSKPVSFLITGVVEDFPGNSTFKADVIQVMKPRNEELSPKEYGTFSVNYLLLKRGTTKSEFQLKANNWYKKFATEKSRYTFEFQPLPDVFLHSEFEKSEDFRGSARNIYFLGGVAALLLFIACINFVNLSTARGLSRLKETGIRKVLSAKRSDLMAQYLSEGLLIFGTAFGVALLIYQLSLPGIEQFLNHKLTRLITTDPVLLAVAFAATSVTWLATALYPAWLLSGFRPADVLKGSVLSKSFLSTSLLRRGLVVVQLAISILVLVGLIIARNQLDFLAQKEIGYNKNHLLSTNYLSWDGQSEAFRSEVRKLSGIESFSFSQWLPTRGAGYMSREYEDSTNPGTKIKIWYISGDIELARTLQLKLKNGRLLDPGFTTDALNADSLQAVDWAKYEETIKAQPALVTETAAKLLKIKNLDLKNTASASIPVGIVANFNNESLYESIKPTVITATKTPQYGGMLIRTQPGQERNVAQQVERIFKKMYPSKVLELELVSDLLARQYAADALLSRLLSFFSLLTMFLALMGIFGLAMQVSEQRTKEIGVRKVLGASIAGIVALLNRDFVKLVIAAFAMAAPAGWLLMNKWLDNFAYRVELEWWFFALAALATLVVTLVTVSFQSVKAAIVNPVKSLRNE